MIYKVINKKNNIIILLDISIIHKQIYIKIEKKYYLIFSRIYNIGNKIINNLIILILLL